MLRAAAAPAIDRCSTTFSICSRDRDSSLIAKSSKRRCGGRATLALSSRYRPTGHALRCSKCRRCAHWVKAVMSILSVQPVIASRSGAALLHCRKFGKLLALLTNWRYPFPLVTRLRAPARGNGVSARLDAPYRPPTWS